MDPVNEHDPTIDKDIVHSVNVNNKKEVAKVRFLTKSLVNAHQVQESIYRQEEKDLIKQLWRLQMDKERHHPELRRSGHGLQRLSGEQIDESESPRRGSYNALNHHPRSYQRVFDDKTSCASRAPETSHPTTSYHHYAPTKGDRHSYDRDNGSSHHRLPFSGTSSHHFNPEVFVHHHRPEYYAVPTAHHRRHSTPGYQPPTETPGAVTQSSRLNAVVQPAGYGHSVAEHAAHLGMHRHYHAGMPHFAYRNPSHGPAGHPSHVTDNIHNIGSYESLTRYINLLDYQASEESRAARRHKGAPHHWNGHKQQGRPSAHLDGHYESAGGRGQSVEEVIRVVGGACLEPASGTTETEVEVEGPSEGKEADEEVREDNSETKPSGAKPKSIAFVGVRSATPSPTPGVTAEATEGEAGRDASHLRRRVEDGPARPTGTLGPGGTQRAKPHGQQGLIGVGVDVPTTRSSRKGLLRSREGGLDTQASPGEVFPRGSSHHQNISRYPSVKVPSRHPQSQLTRQILSDLNAVASQPGHHHDPPTHHRDPHHHPRPHHLQQHQPGQQRHVPHRQRSRESVTTAERKRLAVELLAREYPVLLRHAPTKFDPLEALMCRYLRLSSTNVETLEEMCREAGVEVGAHAHCQIENPTEYVFGREKL